MFSNAKELRLKKIPILFRLHEEISPPHPSFSVVPDWKIRLCLASHTDNSHVAIKKKNDHWEQLDNIAHPLKGEDKEHMFMRSTSIAKKS